MLIQGSRQVHLEKLAECLCTDHEEADMFVEKLCVVTGFYLQEPDKLASAGVRSNLSKPVTVLCDRVTNRPRQNVERNLLLNLRHSLYRGKLHKFLNKFKSDAGPGMII